MLRQFAFCHLFCWTCIFSSSGFLFSQVQNPLLSPPSSPNPASLLAAFHQQEHPLTFWQNRSFSSQSAVRGFEYSKGSVTLCIEYEGVLPPSLSEEERLLFRCHHERGIQRYRYTFGAFDPTPDTTSESSSSQWAKPVYQGQTPQKIGVEKCAEIIHNHRVLFFTGAGISASAGIFTLQNLERELGIDYSQEVDEFTKKALHQPEDLVIQILRFYQKARDESPTAAHASLARIVCHKSCQVLTGNFDLLHERSGIVPLRVYLPLEVLHPQWLKEVDYLICIGMSRDIAHVIEQYKQANPHGYLIAIDKTPPTFLQERDYYLGGDAQELVPQIEKAYTHFALHPS